MPTLASLPASGRHPASLRKDPSMQHIELRLSEVREHQQLLRTIREADRVAPQRPRSIRHQLGESIVRLGRRVGGDAMTSPAWQG